MGWRAFDSSSIPALKHIQFFPPFFWRSLAAPVLHSVQLVIADMRPFFSGHKWQFTPHTGHQLQLGTRAVLKWGRQTLQRIGSWKRGQSLKWRKCHPRMWCPPPETTRIVPQTHAACRHVHQDPLWNALTARESSITFLSKVSEKIL